MKTLEEYFRDWHSDVFGYGYGTGEVHTIPALRRFIEAMPLLGSAYRCEDLERQFTPLVAWLLINAMCKSYVIDYGTSPRFGWLSLRGERVKEFMMARDSDALYEIVCDVTEDYVPCYPDACNCGPDGYDPARKCPNPFWA